MHGDPILLLLLPISFSYPNRVRIDVMVHRLAYHKFQHCYLATLVLMGACAVVGNAQQPPKKRPGPIPRMIILPAKVIAGTQATLAVLDSQGRLLPDITVELSGGQKVTTDVTGRAVFNAPGQPGALVAKISGRGINAFAPVAAANGSGPHLEPGSSPGELKIISYPHVLAIHDRFTLEGAGFRSAADSNRVLLNGDPCLVVAASPVSLVVLPGPRVPVGDATLRVSVDGTDGGSFPVSAVLLEFSGPAETPDAGSTGSLILRAHGTTEPLMVEVRNGSPGVIQLLGGNLQRVKTTGGDQNTAPLEVKFLSSGNYFLTARVVSADRR